MRWRGALSRIGVAGVLLSTGVLLSACNPLEAKLKAGLQVMTTNDEPASLFLDGQYLNKTPFIAKDIQPGTYTLRIEPENSDLVAHETTITLRRGLLSVVMWKPANRPELSGGATYEMEKLANSKDTQLSIITIPDNAVVKIDGASQGFSPTTLDEISPGSHEFEVSLPSYETQKHTLNMVAGHHVTITVKLAKAAIDTEATPPPSPAATDSAVPSATSSSAANPSKTASPSASGRALTISGPRVRIKPTDFYYNGQESLRVRATPGNDGAELGFAPVGSEYPYLNQRTNGWYKITFASQEGWVSGQFAELLPQ